MLRKCSLIFALLLLLPALSHARTPISGSLFAGGASMDVDFQFSEPLDFDPEDKGDSLGLGLAYTINDSWHVQLDWSVTDAKDVDINQVTVGLNYRFKTGLTNLYGEVGGFVGAGKLDWQEYPIFFDRDRDDLKSREAAFGPYLGLHYDLSDHWSISLGYRFFVQKYKTNVEVDGERLDFEHKNMQQVLFGIRYHL